MFGLKKIHCLCIFSLMTLLSIAFALLRSARNTIAVADIGGTASVLPYYELIGTLPATILISWALSKLLAKRSIPTVLLLTLTGFITFFLVYISIIYPYWRSYASSYSAASSWIDFATFHWPVLLFFVVAELWKISLISILLWGFLNSRIEMSQAKGLYAPLMLGSSCGGILAGPLTDFSVQSTPLCIQAITIDKWHASFSTQMLSIAFLGIAAGLLFHWLQKHFNTEHHSVRINHSATDYGLIHCLKVTVESKPLSALALIVLTDYVTYTLFEVAFLDLLKKEFPSPDTYCMILAQLGVWSGFLVAFAALVAGPWMNKKFSWMIIALTTPISVFVFSFPFLGILSLNYLNIFQGEFFGYQPLEFALFAGCACYVIGRATKYALLDSAKEIAYIPLSRELQMQGKLAIEGIASRGGRAFASLTIISLTSMFGGVAASVPAAWIMFTAAVSLWTGATVRLGNAIEEMEEQKKAAGGIAAGDKSLELFIKPLPCHSAKAENSRKETTQG